MRQLQSQIYGKAHKKLISATAKRKVMKKNNFAINAVEELIQSVFGKKNDLRNIFSAQCAT